jgi:GrpB-like predicted nucleotidyltransferase (UPF0157 family)
MRKAEVLPYSLEFPKKFERVKKKICKASGRKLDMHHIGSTAITGLGGKGIIDVLIGVKNWKEGREIVKELKHIGFTHVHPKEKGRIFLSNRIVTEFGDVHIHIVRKETKQYEDFLNFRDCLKKNRMERKKYFETKIRLLEKVKGNREKYRILKGRYVESVLRRINKK